MEKFKPLEIFPGPYSIVDKGGHSVTIMADNFDGYEICEVYNAGPECQEEHIRDMAKSTAKLFHAAPDVLIQLIKLYTAVYGGNSVSLSDAINRAPKNDLFEQEIIEAIKKAI